MKAMQINCTRNGLYSSKEKQIRLFIFSIIILNPEFSIPNHLFGVLYIQLDYTGMAGLNCWSYAHAQQMGVWVLKRL